MENVHLSKVLESLDSASLRKGDAMARRGALSFANLDGDSLRAVFQDSKTGGAAFHFSLEEEGFSTRIESLGMDAKAKLAAAAAWLEKFAGSNQERSPRAPLYKGLSSKFDAPKSDGEAPGAKLEIFFLGGPPHAPSKWEKTLLAVSLSTTAKQYTGNIANLRQLHFHDSLGASLRISDFPSRERQIIRFLAINAEPDGTRVSLDAESLADLLHCLAGFDQAFFSSEIPKNNPRNTRNTARERIHVHREPAKFILFRDPTGKEECLRPILHTHQGLIPMKNATAALGRVGAWVGIGNDYWWIPASIDMAAIRKIVVAGSLGRMLDSHAVQGTDIEILEKKTPTEIRKKSCTPFYDTLPDGGEGIEIRLKFLYSGEILEAKGPNVVFSKGKPWKRDAKGEKKRENELLAAGFVKENSSFSLRTEEAAGMFLDTLARRWFDPSENRAFSAEFAALANGGNGLPLLLCRAGEPAPTTDDGDVLRVKIGFTPAFGKERSESTWKETLQLVRKNRKYAKRNGAFFAISDELARFVRATADFTSPIKDDPQSVTIPRGAIGYWREKLRELSNFQPASAESAKRGNAPPSPPQRQTPGTGELSSFKGTLRHYQADAVEWARTMFDKGLNVVLADEMGLGKTIQTIALLCSLADDGALSAPSMVLCPSSLIDNWKKEFAKFAPSIQCLALKNSAEWRAVEEIPPGTVAITSYALAVRQAKRLAATQLDLLALDEAQHIKNASTTNAKVAKSLKARQKMALTGTPLENRPEELWSIFDFLHPGALGSLNAFKKRYSNVLEDKEAINDLNARTAPFILRRRKAEVEPDLPEKRVQTIPCAMGPKQLNLYEEERWKGLEHLKKIRSKNSNSRFDILANLTRLRQICCHPALIAEHAGTDVDSAKTELLKELLLECVDGGHKTLVFSQFTSFLDIAARWLEKEKIPFVRVDGRVKDRQKVVDSFNSPDGPPVFLLSLKVGGIGFNLVSANRVIIYDPWWNPAAESQATDRTHRIGQTKNVHCVKLVVEDSIESKILELQEKKRKLFKSLVDERPASLKDLSFDDIKYLLE